MKADSKKKMHQDLKEAENLEAMFSVLGKYYDLKQTKPGLIAKGIFIANLSNLTVMLSAKEKPEHK
jgi:hypothetical protein